MPRSINPGSLNVGPGTAPAGTVEDSSVSRFGKTEDPVRVHTQDPIRSHMAVTVGLADVGGFFASEEAEGALQELGALSDTIPLDRQNGWYEAGVQDISSAVTNVNRTITLDGTWTAVCTTGLYDLSGSSILLPDASTVWVFVHGSTGVLTQQVGVPDVTTLEHVVIGRFTCAGNTVTVREDGRFFIRNDNRKISYSVRSDNAAADANSEGSFYSIQAAFLWLETYSTTNVSKKTKLVVRGSNTVTSTLTVPIDDLLLEGESGASIIASAGAPMNLLSLNGKTKFSMTSVRLVSNATGSTAIIDNALVVDGFSLSDVWVVAGTGTWSKGVYFTSVSQTRIDISSCHFEVVGANAVAISMKSPSRAQVSASRFDFNGGGVGPCTGVLLGDKVGGGALGSVVSVVQCVFNLFITTAISVYSSGFEVRHNKLTMTGGTGAGVDILGGSSAGTVDGNDVSGSHLISYSVSGLNNSTDKTTDISVEGNRSSSCLGTGVSFKGFVQNSRIADNAIDGFLGGTESSATGIQLFTNIDSCPGNVVVSRNAVTRCSDGITVVGMYDTRAKADITVTNFANLVAGVSNIIIGGVALLAVGGAPGVNQFQIGVSNNETATRISAAILDPANGFFSSIVHSSVAGAIVTVYAVVPGAQGNGLAVTDNAPTAVTTANLANGKTRSIEGVTVESNIVTNCARSKVGIGPDTFAGTANKGIGLEHTFGCKVLGNDVREIGIMVDGTGTPSIPSTIGTVLESIGIYARNCSRVDLSGNSMFNLARNNAGAVSAAARGIVFYQGSSGVEANFVYNCTEVTISNNTVTWEDRGNGATVKVEGQVGIDVYCDIGTDLTSTSLLLNNLNMQGNQVTHAHEAGYRFIVGNLTQASEFIISENQASVCGLGGTSGGMLLYLADGAVAVAGKSTVLNVAFESNTIDTSEGYGIAVLANRTIGTNEISNMRLSRNRIRSVYFSGIGVEMTSPSLAFSDFEASDNHVQYCGLGGAYSGISVDNQDTTITAFNRVSVKRNSVIGAADVTTPAIFVGSAGGSAPQAIQVDDNVVEAADGTASAGAGIWVSASDNDIGLSRSSFSRNKVFSTYDGLKVSCTSTPIQLSFDGNQIEVSDSASRPLWFLVDRTTHAVEAIGRHISIVGNILRGGRGSLVHSKGGMKIANLTVSKNHFVETAHAAATTAGDSSGFCFAVDTSAGLGASTNPTVRDVLVEGNNFQDLKQEGLTLNLGPGIAGSAYTSSGICTGIQVKGNTFAKTAAAFNGGTLQLAGSAAALRVMTCATTRGLAIEGNSFQDCGAAGATSSLLGVIQIDYISNETVSLKNTSVSGNTLDSSTFTFVKVKNLVKNGACPYANILNLRVCDNQATDLSKNLFWGDLSVISQDYVLENVTIEGNVAAVITGGQDVIYLDLDGDLSGLSVSRNKIGGVHNTSVFIHGLAEITPRVWKGLSFDGNDLSDFTVQGIHHQLETGGSIHSVYGLKFSDNNFYSTAGAVIAINVLHDTFTTLGVWEGLVVSNNQANIPHADAVFFQVDSNLTGATKRCFNFTGNNLVAIGKAGLVGVGAWAAGNKLITLVVVGNSMDLAATTWAAFAAQFNAPAIIAVANNAN